MDDNSRLHLQKMVKANNVEDQTELIRELKHSHLLQDDINNLIMIKAKNRNRTLSFSPRKKVQQDFYRIAF